MCDRSTYLVKQVSIRNRILVLADYLKTAIFGRDMTQLVAANEPGLED